MGKDFKTVDVAVELENSIATLKFASNTRSCITFYTMIYEGGSKVLGRPKGKAKVLESQPSKILYKT